MGAIYRAGTPTLMNIWQPEALAEDSGKQIDPVSFAKKLADYRTPSNSRAVFEVQTQHTLSKHVSVYAFYIHCCTLLYMLSHAQFAHIACSTMT